MGLVGGGRWVGEPGIPSGLCQESPLGFVNQQRSSDLSSLLGLEGSAVPSALSPESLGRALGPRLNLWEAGYPILCLGRGHTYRHRRRGALPL